MVLKTDFTRGMENAQDPLNENFTLLEPLLEDTGWVNIQTVNGFTWSYPGQVRRIGNEVRLRGTIAPTKTTDIANPFSILPEQFRHNWPDPYRFDTPMGSNIIDQTARIYVATNGEMKIIALSSTNGYITLDQINYWVD